MRAKKSFVLLLLLCVCFSESTAQGWSGTVFSLDSDQNSNVFYLRYGDLLFMRYRKSFFSTNEGFAKWDPALGWIDLTPFTFNPFEYPVADSSSVYWAPYPLNPTLWRFNRATGQSSQLIINNIFSGSFDRIYMTWKGRLYVEGDNVFFTNGATSDGPMIIDLGPDTLRLVSRLRIGLDPGDAIQRFEPRGDSMIYVVENPAGLLRMTIVPDDSLFPMRMVQVPYIGNTKRIVDCGVDGIILQGDFVKSQISSNTLFYRNSTWMAYDLPIDHLGQFAVDRPDPVAYFDGKLFFRGGSTVGELDLSTGQVLYHAVFTPLGELLDLRWFYTDGSDLYAFHREAILFSTDRLRIYKYRSSSPVSIDGSFSGEEVVIYPNPTTGFVQMEGLTEQSTLRLRNSLGQQVGEWRVQNDDRISLSHLPVGLYSVEINGQFWGRLVKQ